MAHLQNRRASDWHLFCHEYLQANRVRFVIAQTGKDWHSVELMLEIVGNSLHWSQSDFPAAIPIIMRWIIARPYNEVDVVFVVTRHLLNSVGHEVGICIARTDHFTPRTGRMIITERSAPTTHRFVAFRIGTNGVEQVQMKVSRLQHWKWLSRRERFEWGLLYRDVYFPYDL